MTIGFGEGFGEIAGLENTSLVWI